MLWRRMITIKNVKLNESNGLFLPISRLKSMFSSEGLCRSHTHHICWIGICRPVQRSVLNKTENKEKNYGLKFHFGCSCLFVFRLFSIFVPLVFCCALIHTCTINSGLNNFMYLFMHKRSGRAKRYEMMRKENKSCVQMHTLLTNNNKIPPEMWKLGEKIARMSHVVMQSANVVLPTHTKRESERPRNLK